MHAQLLNELSQKVAVSQVWSGFEFATKPRFSSLIRLEAIADKRKILIRHIQTFLFGYQVGIKSWVSTHINFKQIELENPGWSGFVANSKPDQT